MGAPTPGPCEPWVTSAQLRNMVDVRKAIEKAVASSTKATNATPLSDEMIDETLARSVGTATEVLFGLSGRRYAGNCFAIIRPVARPVDIDTVGMMYHTYSYSGYGNAGTLAMKMPPAFSIYGENVPPVIAFDDYPIRAIEEVKIDGVVIPPSEYELRGHKELVRIRPTAESQPTERWGWPTAQIQDIPDDQLGTFSIAYWYGADPGEAGRSACLRLAEMYACANLGDTSRYPERTVSISRQGVTAQIASITDIVKSGGTGLHEVDLWLQAVNPGRQRQRPLVWSASRQNNRRQ